MVTSFRTPFLLCRRFNTLGLLAMPTHLIHMARLLVSLRPRFPEVGSHANHQALNAIVQTQPFSTAKPAQLFLRVWVADLKFSVSLLVTLCDKQFEFDLLLFSAEQFVYIFRFCTISIVASIKCSSRSSTCARSLISRYTWKTVLIASCLTIRRRSTKQI